LGLYLPLGERTVLVSPLCAGAIEGVLVALGLAGASPVAGGAVATAGRGRGKKKGVTGPIGGAAAAAVSPQDGVRSLLAAAAVAGACPATNAASEALFASLLPTRQAAAALVRQVCDHITIACNTVPPAAPYASRTRRSAAATAQHNAAVAEAVARAEAGNRAVTAILDR